MTLFPDIASLLRLFTASRAFATGTPTLERWPLFDSGKELPDLTPYFTLRYPPSFARHLPSSVNLKPSADPRLPPCPNASVIVDFSREFRKSGRAVSFSVGRRPWDSESPDLQRQTDSQDFWIRLGNELGSDGVLTFEGAKHFKTEDFNSADLMFSRFSLSEPHGFSAFLAARMVIAGKWQYIFTSVCLYPPGESLDYTANANPMFQNFIKPIFQTISFTP
ncbi:MAG: hypothetical protein LBR80_18465 [Deltaproteobacteria bacterium]|jgi:hypothetical protein|nr:hypothetical protein [Deltaproteobacteria bacterium]